MRRNIPNALTLCRAVLAIIFFVVLGSYRQGAGPDGALVAAFVLFVAAGLTDIADGYLARRWDAVSAFGRIMDPFCDKLLVLGGLILLAGPRFVDPNYTESGQFHIIRGNLISGIYPWMVVVMLSRELLVTAIRGELESRGIEFPAKVSGKIKTGVQMVLVPTSIATIWLHPYEPGHEWMVVLRTVLAYGAVIVTLISGVPYVTGAIRAAKLEPRKPE